MVLVVAVVVVVLVMVVVLLLEGCGGGVGGGTVERVSVVGWCASASACMLGWQCERSQVCALHPPVDASSPTRIAQGVDERVEAADFVRGIGFYVRLIELASIADESATEAGVAAAE